MLDLRLYYIILYYIYYIILDIYIYILADEDPIKNLLKHISKHIKNT